MARLSDMMMTYFMLGAVMWASGFLEWEETGLATFFLSLASGDVSGASEITRNLTDMGGPIGNVVNTLGGGLLAIWQFVQNLISYVFWPVTVLVEVQAPVEIVVLGGGSISVAFVGAFIMMIRGSA